MSASWNLLFLQLLLLLISCRHISAKTPGPTPPPLAPASTLPNVAKSLMLRGGRHTENIELLDPVNLDLGCTWTGNENKPQNISGHWTKDGSEIMNSSVTVQLENDQYNLRQTFSVVNASDLGIYSCVFGDDARIDFVLAVPQITEKRDKPVIGYLGDFMVIQCKIDDTRPTPASWKWSKINGTEKELIDAAAEPNHYKVKTEERKTKLLLHNLTEADAGLYVCAAVYAVGAAYSRVELKIITLWEPLKLFIGILVEVIVLVAAILLYERSQSKKTCAAENEPNPDQRNTLTQEENNDQDGDSAVRQRKV